MADLFRVGVTVYLVDRATRELGRIEAALSGGAVAAARMQRGLVELERAQAALARGSVAAADIEARRIGSLQRRLQLQRDELAIIRRRIVPLAPVSLERRRLLEAQEQRKLLQVAATEEAIRNQEARAGLRTETLRTKQLQLQERTLESQAALQRATFEAAQRRRLTVGVTAGALGGIGLYAIGHSLLEPAAQAEKARVLAGIAGQLAPTQETALSQAALRLSLRLGIVDWTQTIGILHSLLAPGLLKFSQLQLGKPGGVAELMAQASDLIAQQRGGDPAEIAAALTRIPHTLGVYSGPRFLNALQLATTAALRADIGPDELSTFLSYVGGPSTFAGLKVPDIFSLAIFSKAETALQGSASARNVAQLIRELSFPSTKKEQAGLDLLRAHGLREPTLLNIAEVTRTLTHKEIGDIGSKLLQGRAGRLFELMAIIPAPLLEQVQKITRAPLQIEQSWTKLMNTLSGQTMQLTANFKTLGAVIGGPLAKNVEELLKGFQPTLQALVKAAAAHPEISGAIGAGAAGISTAATVVSVAALTRWVLAAAGIGLGAASGIAVAVTAGTAIIMWAHAHWAEITSLWERFRHPFTEGPLGTLPSVPLPSPEFLRKYFGDLLTGRSPTTPSKVTPWSLLRDLKHDWEEFKHSHILSPEGGGRAKGASFHVEIHPGAIKVEGTADPEATAHALLKTLAHELRRSLITTTMADGVFEPAAFHSSRPVEV